MCRRLGFGVSNPTQACAAEADCLWFLLLGIRSILATDNAQLTNAIQLFSRQTTAIQLFSRQTQLSN